MQAFVIEFNRHTGGRRLTELPTSHAAMDRRLELERTRSNPDVEICALTTTSIESLQRTHARYFIGEEVDDPYQSAV